MPGEMQQITQIVSQMVGKAKQDERAMLVFWLRRAGHTEAADMIDLNNPNRLADWELFLLYGDPTIQP